MKAKVTISRNSNDEVVIRIRDCGSGIEFAKVAMSVETYGYAITGLSEQPGELEVRGLQWVGKTRVSEPRKIECPLDSHDRETLENWLKEHAKEEGWIVSTYLGSQKSIERVKGKTTLHYSVTKYIEPDEPKAHPHD